MVITDGKKIGACVHVVRGAHTTTQQQPQTPTTTPWKQQVQNQHPFNIKQQRAQLWLKNVNSTSVNHSFTTVSSIVKLSYMILQQTQPSQLTSLASLMKLKVLNG